MEAKIFEYDKNWEAMFKAEAKKLKKALGKNCVYIQHIRDTSFKNQVCVLDGKLKIFILICVKKLDGVAPDSLSELGYKQDVYEGYKKDGETDIILWFVDNVTSSCQESSSAELSLRNYMIVHPEKAKEYSEYKAKAVSESEDRMSVISAEEKFLDNLRPEIDKWTKEQSNISMGISLGICFGMSIGLAIGSAMGNTAVGMTTGMSIGMCLGVAFAYSKNKNNNG